MKKKQIKLYNIIVPFWLLIWFPSLLWLILIPANFIIDGLVLWFCKKKLKIEDINFLRKNTWRVCIFGFLGDFLGVMILFGSFIALNQLDTNYNSAVVEALSLNVFTNFFALLITVLSIIVAGVAIYFLNYQEFKSKTDFWSAKYIAIRLAIITAPYLFLLPTSLFYR